jgi:hypothetical protein
MLMAYLTLITGLLISAVAIFYSVAGLTAIFSAAVVPIIVMGVALEVAKLVATVWVKQNWSIAPRLLKSYLVVAIIVLMFITSLGIFGFLSKAHSDQSLVSGDVQSRIAIYDEKIKIERENIANSQQLIQQMDAAVNGIISTGDQEVKLRDGSTRINSAAERSLQIRRSQSKDRAVLTKQIEEAQGRILALQEQRAPIAAEVRKVEAEVGPIKYIAAFIYGDNPDANLLEKAVTWVIVLIVIVFDPLAVMLLLASQYSFALLRPKEEQPLINDVVSQPAEYVAEPETNSLEYPIDSDPPIPAFLLKKNQLDLDAINLELAEAAVIPEPLEPEVEVLPAVEYKILEDADDDEFIVEVPYVHQTGTDNPIDFPKFENYEIMHTSEGVTLIDTAGKTTDIPLDLAVEEQPVNDSNALKNLIAKHGYSIENGIAKINGVEVPADTLKDLLDTGYVQNEEQKESDTWSKIVNKNITEEEYLKAVQQNKKV